MKQEHLTLPEVHMALQLISLFLLQLDLSIPDEYIFYSGPR
jgi:hypothetical protein